MNALTVGVNFNFMVILIWNALLIMITIMHIIIFIEHLV